MVRNKFHRALANVGPPDALKLGDPCRPLAIALPQRQRPVVGKVSLAIEVFRPMTILPGAPVELR
jgi:hypothetical protein